MNMIRYFLLMTFRGVVRRICHLASHFSDQLSRNHNFLVNNPLPFQPTAFRVEPEMRLFITKSYTLSI